MSAFKAEKIMDKEIFQQKSSIYTTVQSNEAFLNEAKQDRASNLELDLANFHEQSSELKKNYLLEIINFETERSNEDLRELAEQAIVRLKETEMDRDTLKNIASWYATTQPNDAMFWLNRAKELGVAELDLYYGYVHFAMNDYKNAIKFYLVSLKSLPTESLEAIEELEIKLTESDLKQSLNVSDLIEIVEAFKVNNNFCNAVKWLIKATKWDSLKVEKLLKEMIGDANFRNEQYIIGEYFEEVKQYEIAMTCYKKSYSLNKDDDLSDKLPWEENSNNDDEGLFLDNIEYPCIDEPYLPLEMLKPVGIFYQNGIEYELTNNVKEKFKVT